jgi:protein O-GlcNAc transferase
MTSAAIPPPEVLRRAVEAYNDGKFSEAERLCQAVTAAKPDFFDGLLLLANIQLRLGRGKEALASYDRAVALRPDDAVVLNNRGVILQELKRFDEALASYERAIALRPDFADALYNRGAILQELKRLEDALASYDQVLAIRTDHAAALHNRGIILHALKRFEDALASFEQALAVRSDFPEALNSRGISLHALRRFEDALASYEQVLAMRPGHLEALSNRGVILYELRRFEEALASYEQLLATRPNDVVTLYNRGITLHEVGHFEDALASFEQALAARPDYAEALNSRGVTLHELRRFEEALASYEQALAVRPGYAEALSNRGITLHELKRFEDALASYEQVLALRPDDAAVLYNRGNTLRELRRFEEALASHDQALAARSGYAEALHSRGIILHELKRFADALASYELVLAVRPGYAEALNSRGITLHALKRFDAALASFEEAIATRPGYALALSNRGILLQELKRFDEAIASFEKAMALEPNHKYALSGLADCAIKVCDWGRREKLFGEVCRHVGQQQSIMSPFLLLGYSADQSLQLLCGRNYFRDLMFVPPQPLWRGAIWRNDKIKIAYISADFRRHPTAYLMAELFELHDRSQFEVMAISLAPDDRSEMRARLAGAFDQFFDVTRRSDQDVARLLNDLRVDIAVDLQGHTKDARPGILAFRPTPIQVNYLAFPGTLGADFIDYIIADPVILPLDRQPYYTENIVHLPECYQVNDRKRAIAARTPTRAEVGLPAQGFIFCCFNNNWKITPEVFNIWMRLLRRVEDSVLWLLSDNKDAERNLRKEAVSRGVDPARLVFAERTKIEDHLARHRLADLFLDTLPYNAHATASDALWTGIPVLTCQGNAFAARVAASLLKAIGVPELVTHSLEEYEARALRLARDPDLLRNYRNRLAENRLTQPLFDTDRFRRHIEVAYRRMWKLWQKGEEPKSFEVAAQEVES